MWLKTCLFFIFSFVLIGVSSEDCEKCIRSECPKISFCPFGVVPDDCACCDKCSQELSQKCDLDDTDANLEILRTNKIDEEILENKIGDGDSVHNIKKRKSVHGQCGEFLTCNEKNLVCHCVENDPVCGSDGITYGSVCKLLAASQQQHNLTVTLREPCRKGPVIKSPPEAATRPLGSILILDCEATGSPVPSVSWELNREDGSTIQLPNDDSLVAVQVRGGPEKNMVTGWVQIMKIMPRNVGLYTCIATNSEGSVQASAKISMLDTKKLPNSEMPGEDEKEL